jgi:Mrp family chromosome partitioning ATPase
VTAIDARSDALRPGGTFELTRARLDSLGLLPPEQHAVSFNQQYRRLKRSLLGLVFGAAMPDREAGGRVVLVTSAIAAEGKSFVSLNLALSFALEPEVRVVLIDGDVPKRTLTRGLGLDNRPGLLDVSADHELSVDSCVYADASSRLLFVPSGPWRDEAPELLGSARMHSILTEIARRAAPCVVIVDSPPLHGANEARSLLSSANHLLFVVRAGHATQGAVTEALASVSGACPVSIVMNDYAGKGLDEYRYGYS